MEHTVFAGKFKSLDVFESADGAKRVVEVDIYEVARHLHVLKRWTHAAHGLHPVGFVQREIGQSLTYGFLLCRVNLRGLVGVGQIVRADQTAVGDYFRSLILLFAQASSVVGVDIVVMIGRNLHEIERNLPSPNWLRH